jgi:DNA-binding PadR family transcriptional regulator
MVKNAKSYIVTEKGQKELLELKGMDIEWIY